MRKAVTVTEIKARDARVWKLARTLAAHSPFATFDESPVSIGEYDTIADAVDKVAQEAGLDPGDPHEHAAFLYGVAVGLEMAGRGAR